MRQVYLRVIEVSFVLDSWPLVAWFKNQEPAASLTDDLLLRHRRGEIKLLISVINLGEVYYSVAKSAGAATAERALETILSLAIQVVPTTDEEVMRAARLKGRNAIAYGDAFAAALAIDRRVPLITGDKELLQLANAGVLAVEWVGEPVSK